MRWGRPGSGLHLAAQEQYLQVRVISKRVLICKEFYSWMRIMLTTLPLRTIFKINKNSRSVVVRITHHFKKKNRRLMVTRDVWRWRKVESALPEAEPPFPWSFSSRPASFIEKVLFFSLPMKKHYVYLVNDIGPINFTREQHRSLLLRLLATNALENHQSRIVVGS